jgi:hypothetical protein
LQAPEVKSQLANEGAKVVGNTLGRTAAMVRADLEQRVEVVHRNNIRPD